MQQQLNLEMSLSLMVIVTFSVMLRLICDKPVLNGGNGKTND